MSLVVIDAPVLVAFYAADDPRRAVVAERLKAGATLLAPAHLDAEVVSALRGMARGNPTLEQAVPDALMTCDARLAAANGPTCAFDLIA